MIQCDHLSDPLRSSNQDRCRMAARFFSEFWTGKRTVRHNYCTRHSKRRGKLIEGLCPIDGKAVTK